MKDEGALLGKLCGIEFNLCSIEDEEDFKF